MAGSKGGLVCSLWYQKTRKVHQNLSKFETFYQINDNNNDYLT